MYRKEPKKTEKLKNNKTIKFIKEFNPFETIKLYFYPNLPSNYPKGKMYVENKRIVSLIKFTQTTITHKKKCINGKY